MNVMRQDVLSLLARFPLVGLLICLGLAVFTSNKLYKMAQIEGVLPGASSLMVQVANKGMESGRRGEPYFWAEWQDNRFPENRIRLEQGFWETLNVGDELEVRQVPGDSNVYSKNDVYTEPGNYVFDVVLFVAEIAGVGLFLFRLLGTRKKVLAS